MRFAVYSPQAEKQKGKLRPNCWVNLCCCLQEMNGRFADKQPLQSRWLCMQTQTAPLEPPREPCVRQQSLQFSFTAQSTNPTAATMPCIVCSTNGSDHRETTQTWREEETNEGGNEKFGFLKCKVPSVRMFSRVKNCSHGSRQQSSTQSSIPSSSDLRQRVLWSRDQIFTKPLKVPNHPYGAASSEAPVLSTDPSSPSVLS